MRVLNTIGILASVGIFWYGRYIISAIDKLFRSSYGYYGTGYAHLDAGITNLGLNGAFFMIIVGFFFLGLYIGNLNQILRRTVKVISIIGIIFSSLFILMNIIFIANNNADFFGATYLAWWLFGLIGLAFSIVLLVQAVRDYRQKMGLTTAQYSDDVIDDFDVI